MADKELSFGSKRRNNCFKNQDDDRISKQLLEAYANESIIIFKPKDKLEDKRFMAFGYPTRIERGEKYDLVFLRCGSTYIRKIVVENNNARKQIYTLKKHEFCEIYGLFKYANKKGFMFATAIQGWYIPRVIDIKHEDNEDIEQLEEEETDILALLKKND